MSDEEVKKVIPKEYAIVRRFGKVLNRYEAVKLFNNIGRYVAKLKEAKENGKLESLIENLSKLAEGEIESFKMGNTTITKEAFDNIVYALPTSTRLNQKHIGGKWITVVNADFASNNRTETPTQNEIDARTELILSLINNYRKVKDEDTVEEGGISTESGSTAEYRTGVSIAEGSVRVTFGKYDYQTESVTNANSNIFQQNGQQMSRKEVVQWYNDKAPEFVQPFEENVDGLVDLLSQLGYSITKEKLAEVFQGDEGQASNLQQLVLGIAKYGDGVISAETFIREYVVKAVGTAASTKKVKEANIERAKAILDYARDVNPNMFLSNKNYQDDNKLTPSTLRSTEDAVKGKWFNGKRSVKVFVNGEEMDTKDTPENIATIATIMDNIETLIRNSKNASEFIESLDNLGYSFKRDGS
jgi:hypothetical protein